MSKPRIYWCYYPKLRRGFWRVRPKDIKLKYSDWGVRQYAYRMVKEMNDAEDRAFAAREAERLARRRIHSH